MIGYLLQPLQVVFSRNVIMAPGMIVLPLAMARLERRAWFARATYLHAPFQACRHVTFRAGSIQ